VKRLLQRSNGQRFGIDHVGRFSKLEAVADSWLRRDLEATSRGLGKLGTEAFDVDIDAAITSGHGVTPHLAVKAVAADRSAGRGCERLEHLPLAPSEANLGPSAVSSSMARGPYTVAPRL
jgi:hypothetical protein